MYVIVPSWWASVTLVMSLALCFCWRKKTPTDEWQGLDGMVIQKNPDENVNHLPSAALCIENSDSESTRRNIVTTTQRSLPDIPAEQSSAVNWGPAGDNSSEHYATVGQYSNAGKRNTIANEVEPKIAIPQYNSLTQAEEKPYERVKYDKMNSKEHPYAQLQPTTSRPGVYEENQSTSEERINLLRPDEINSTDPTLPSISRRSSTQSTEELDIPAASAVAGVVDASPELPYMTPPVTQVNFSGDSQDSSKGYTSITVREPLANIIAETKKLHKNKRELDPHYSTVSDDSDDVYTTIADPNNPIYSSESDTYARIPPLPITVVAEVNQSPSETTDADPVDELYEPPPQPQPPSVDSLKQVASHSGQSSSHSRQASSSSSIANLGSPKPEKRQANSPLPPPPPTINNFDFHADKIQAIKNLDDLYAKVHKTKKDESDEKTSETVFDRVDNRSLSGINLLDSESQNHSDEHNYETLKKNLRHTSDPGYEKIRSDEPGYASINGPESIPSSDPGYEELKNKTTSEVDPNYEELRHKASNASDCSEYSRIRDIHDGYSIINKIRKIGTTLTVSNDVIDEPNYESMPSEFTIKSNGSDPNYELVIQNDANYDTIKDLDEPPYERLDENFSRGNFEVSRSDTAQHKGYDNPESCKLVGKSPTEMSNHPPGQLNINTDSEIPGYEQIKPKSGSPSHLDSSKNSIEESFDVIDQDGVVQV